MKMLSLIACLALFACAKPDQAVVYKDIPVVSYEPCNVDFPEKPILEASLLSMINNLLLYTRLLEAKLIYCTE